MRPVIAFARTGSVVVRTLGTDVTATQADPTGLVFVAFIGTAFALVLAAPAIVIWAMQRRGAIWWDAKDDGLVRTSAAGQQVIPWSSFTRVDVVRTGKGRGHVRLWDGRIRTHWRLWFRAGQGKVWTFSSFLYLVDIEAPEGLASIIRERLSTTGRSERES